MADQTVVEMIKERVHIEDVIEADGFHLRKTGRYAKCTQHDSLVVDVQQQAYFWNSNSEHGDVINWVMARKRMDFKGAVEEICRTHHLQEPTWGHQSMVERVIERERETIFGVAVGVLVDWRARDPDVLSYCAARGWTTEILSRAMIGYTGAGEQRTDLRNEMLKAFITANIDPECPAAAAIIGWSGDVAGWSRKFNINPVEKWAQQKYIPGLIGRDMIIYPHIKNGRVRYLSGRGVHEKIHYNLPRELVGPKQLYYNLAWASTEKEIVICEGQADALSLYQLGIPAIAIVGNRSSSEDLKRLSDAILSGSKDAAKKYAEQVYYIGLDSDKGGAAGVDTLAEMIGPMCRMITWTPSNLEWISPDDTHWCTREEAAKVKDGNDLLRLMIFGNVALEEHAGISPEEHPNVAPEEQAAHARRMMQGSRTYIEVVCEQVGTMVGAKRDEAQLAAIALIEKMGEKQRAQYKSKLAKLLDIPLRDLDRITKANKDEDASEIEETLGGPIGDNLVEVTYDPDTMRTALVVREENGQIHTLDHVVIDGKRYIPLHPNKMLIKNVVLFPSQLGSLRSVRELIEIIRNFIHAYVDLDQFYEKLSSYYVLFTWLYDCFQVLPYLRALGDYGTGKTRLIWTVGVLCYRPIFTGGATTVSPIFRMLDSYHGTLILDEADFGNSDETSDIIKILNTGYMKGVAVLRSVANAEGNYDPDAYDVYGPKIIATRKTFADRATESRCLTKEMGGGIPRDDIPLVLPIDFWNRAREIRNLLLAYRMKFWRPDIEIDYNMADRKIEARLNQVTLALKQLVDDDGMREEIDQFIRHYNQQLMTERSMTPEAKVLEAILAISKTEKKDFGLKAITKKANEIIDAENNDDDGDDSKRKKLTPKGVGRYIRVALQLETERTREGYMMVWNDKRITALKARFGIDDEMIEAKASVAYNPHTPPPPEDPPLIQDELPV